MTDANYKQKLIDTFRKLSENYAGQWTPTASKTGFLLSLKEGAIYISTLPGWAGYKKTSGFIKSQMMGLLETGL